MGYSPNTLQQCLQLEHRARALIWIKKKKEEIITAALMPVESI